MRFIIITILFSISLPVVSKCWSDDPEVCEVTSEAYFQKNRRKQLTERTKRRLKYVLGLYVRQAEETLKASTKDGIDTYLDQMDHQAYLQETFRKWDQ